MRISAIVDARFSLIVDDETASSRVRRGGAQAPGVNVPRPSTISLKRSGVELVSGLDWPRFYLSKSSGPCQGAAGAPLDRFAHGLGGLEHDLVTAVHNPVEDGIGQRRVVEVGVPILDRQLAGDWS